MKIILLTILSTLLTLALVAKEFQHLTTIEGLSQNDVNCIFQDSRGFIWIGTNDGLNRYDGYNFKIFRRKPRQQDGLVSNIVFAIDEAPNGSLWIGTSDNGVCEFNVSTNKFTQYSNTLENPELLGSNRTFNVVVDDQGKVWIANEKGINVIDPKNNKIHFLSTTQIINTQKIKNQKNTLRALFKDSDGNIWLGSSMGLLLMDKDKIEIVDTYSKSGQSGISDIIERNNNLVLSMSNGIFLFNKSKKTFEKISQIPGGGDIVIDNEDNLWKGSNHGLYYNELISTDPIEYENKTIFESNQDKSGLSNNIISALCKDNSGMIWIGTNGGGVNLYNPQRKLFNHYKTGQTPGSVSVNKIRSIYEDDNKNLWIGTEGGGLNFLSSSKGKNYNNGFQQRNVTKINQDNRAYAFAEAKEARLIFVGTGYPSMLKIYHKDTGKEIAPSVLGIPKTNSVFSIIVDSDQCVWLGTYGGGLWRLTPKDGKYSAVQFVNKDESYALSSNLIRSLLEDHEGNIWIGTGNGLNKILKRERNSDHPRFFSYKNMPNNLNSISHNYILPIFESSKGDLWIGTMGGGLNRYNKSADGADRFESITTEDGLPSDVIKGILEDEKGNLWISSNRGLTRYNPSDSSINNYDVGDGLQDYEFGELACFKRHDGEMIFGGVNGFNTFYPSEISEDKTVGKVVLTDIDILNQPINVGEEVRGRILLKRDINETKELELKYAENSFSVYFSGLHFAAPRKNQYKYILEGFDEEWVPTSSEARFAKYTNLRPGTYSLKVMASNSDGFWNETPKTMDITVIAPWWYSKPALGVYILLVLLLLWFFRRFTVIGVQNKNQLMMERFEKEKVQELSQLKLRFFTNISHEFRTPLTLIIGPIEKLIKEKSTLSEENVTKNHEIIHRNANILLRLINQLMDFRKFEQGKMKMRASEANVVNFVEEIYESFSMMAQQKEIEFSYLPSSDNISLWFDPDKMEKVIYNLLSNAFKFTLNSGKINMEVSEDDAHVYITVEDTGVGIPKEMQSHVFERFYQADKIAHNKKLGSTGIGLAYTKGLVEMHHGEIDLNSEEGKGTKFIVTLPKGKRHFKNNEIVVRGELHPEDADAWVSTTEYNPEDEKQEEVILNSEMQTLLVVEDNTELRKFIKDSLSNQFRVIEAENGEEGLEQCNQYHPDLIVSDVMMPKMDGFEMCEKIKGDVNLSHTPVILLTAKTASEDKIKGYNLGADAYVAKPFDFEVLKAQIENLIKKREALKNNFNKKLDIQPSEVATTSMDEKFLNKILNLIEDKLTDPAYTVEQLASEYGISQSILNRKLKSLTGKTTKAFIRSIRLKRAAQLLTTGRYSVADVTYEVGFSDLKYFRTCFKTEFSLSPSDYKKQHVNNTSEDESENGE